MNKTFVNISNKWFRNGDEDSMLKKYGSESLMVYSLMMGTLTYQNKFIFSINYFADRLHISTDNTRMIDKIKTGLKQLNDNVIKIYDDFNLTIENNKFGLGRIYYATPLIEIPKDNYFKVFDEELEILYDSLKESKTTKSEITAQLLYLLSCMGNKEGEDNYKICYPSNEKIKKNACLEISDIVRYNKVLEQIRLIAIDNAGMFKNEDDKYSNDGNNYSRYEDKEILNKKVDKHRQNIQIAIDYSTKKGLQDVSRSKAKQIQEWKKTHRMDSISEEEFYELFLLEQEHYNIRKQINPNKIHLNGGYHTLYVTKDGKMKDYEQYIIHA